MQLTINDEREEEEFIFFFSIQISQIRISETSFFFLFFFSSRTVEFEPLSVLRLTFLGGTGVMVVTVVTVLAFKSKFFSYYARVGKAKARVFFVDRILKFCFEK
jgi:hypothetical protein